MTTRRDSRKSRPALEELEVRDVPSAGLVTGPIFDPNTNMNLYVLSPDTWTNAETAAESLLGGHLATVVSAADNDFIVNNVLTDFSSGGGPNLSQVPVWIGLSDPQIGDGSGDQHTADFVWADGSTSAYRNWQSGQPNNFAPGEYYAAINWHFADGGGPRRSAPGTTRR